jgi:hypothetical protein
LGLPMIGALVAYFSPSKIMGFFARPGLFLLMFLALFFVGMAGFRNSLFQAGFYILLATYLWDKGLGVFRMAVILAAALALAIALQTIHPLPNSIQRSLSFIPGPWSEQIKEGSKESTDWRVEMWKIALTTDRYIKNKWIGDGFGFSALELQIMQSANFGGVGFIGEDAQKEAFMVQGSFHSGPLSSIRFAGYIGLLAILMMLVAIAVYAVNMLKLAWNTPYRPLAILLVLGAVYGPFVFILIFGEYRDTLPTTFFSCGMLKMLHNSLRANVLSNKPVGKTVGPALNQSPSLHPQPALVGANFYRH